MHPIEAVALGLALGVGAYCVEWIADRMIACVAWVTRNEA